MAGQGWASPRSELPEMGTKQRQCLGQLCHIEQVCHLKPCWSGTGMSEPCRLQGDDDPGTTSFVQGQEGEVPGNVEGADAHSLLNWTTLLCTGRSQIITKIVPKIHQKTNKIKTKATTTTKNPPKTKPKNRRKTGTDKNLLALSRNYQQEVPCAQWLVHCAPSWREPNATLGKIIHYMEAD